MDDMTNYGDRRMTVVEVAKALGVTPEAIKKHIRELFPEMLQNGIITYLNEFQVTEIKRRMIPTTQVVGATTDMEMRQKAAEVMAWLMRDNEQLKAENSILIPKAAVADRIAISDGRKSLSEIGKINGIGPRKIFDLLASLKIIFRSGQSWVPYQEYIDRGLFVVRESTYEINGGDHLYSKTYVTGKGEVWLAKRLFGTDID